MAEYVEQAVPFSVSARCKSGVKHVVASCLASIFMLASMADAQEGGGAPPPAVTVMEVKASDVMLSATVPGRVVPAATAEVRPQVNGIITERLFKEGSHVALGDVLYTIDSATYEASLGQAQAAVAQARAQSKSAESEAARIQELKRQNVSTQRELDQAIAARDVAKASIAVAEAQLKSAQIELDRTTITAPLSGEIGLAMTTRGALVTASQAAPLAVIRNMDTVYVDVTAAASRVLDWRQNNMQTDWRETNRKVRLILANGKTYSHDGSLSAAEPQVDPQTGVIVLRMEFANPDQLLLPGAYVKVELDTDLAKDVFVLPQRAVSRDRQGRPVAFVVNADDVVEQRDLTVLQDLGNNWVVKDGVKAGERLVLEGMQKAAPGATVTAQPEEAKASEETAASGDSAAADDAAAEKAQ